VLSSLLRVLVHQRTGVAVTLPEVAIAPPGHWRTLRDVVMLRKAQLLAAEVVVVVSWGVVDILAVRRRSWEEKVTSYVWDMVSHRSPTLCSATMTRYCSPGIIVNA
jgi:hypothetical protein